MAAYHGGGGDRSVSPLPFSLVRRYEAVFDGVGSFLEQLTGASWVGYAQNRLVGRREGQKRGRNSFKRATREVQD